MFTVRRYSVVLEYISANNHPLDHPSYYHFHIHAVSISHDGGLGQSAGRAFLLGNIISQLETMTGEDSGLADVELTVVLGEESELWQTVFKYLRQST